MSSRIITVYFTDGQSAVCGVNYDYTAFYRGRRDTGPDEAAYCDINEIMMGELDITKWVVVDMDRLQEDLCNAHEARGLRDD